MSILWQLLWKIPLLIQNAKHIKMCFRRLQISPKRFYDEQFECVHSYAPRYAASESNYEKVLKRGESSKGGE